MSVKCLASSAFTWALSLLDRHEQSVLIGEQLKMSHSLQLCSYQVFWVFSLGSHQCSTLVWSRTGCLLTGGPWFPFLIWLLFSKDAICAHAPSRFSNSGHLRYKPSLASPPLGDRISLATTWADREWLRTKEKNEDMSWMETWTGLPKLIIVMLPQT